jgi:hypothetical protein
VNGFIDRLYTPLGTTNNCSAITEIHKSLHAKSTSALSVFNGLFLVTDVNSGDSLASRVKVLPVRRISRTLSIKFSQPGVLVI